MLKFRKSMLINLFFSLLFILIGCFTPSGSFNTFSWPKSVPEANIVFQSSMNTSTKLYFIKDDGSNLQILNIFEKFSIPVWSSDGKRLYGLSTAKGVASPEYLGFPAYWNINNGEFKRCSNNLPFFWQIEEYKNSGNPNIVILYNTEEIVLFDMQSCQEIQKFVDYTNRTGEFGISGFSYKPDTEELLFGEFTVPYPSDFRIIKLNLKTKDRVEIAKGVNPAWSPDGSKIAYVGVDGLYIIQTTKRESKCILQTQFFDPLEGGSPQIYAPKPQWSQDSEWLVYHQCINKYCKAKETLIYKIRVSNGYVEKIFTGGEYPSWRP